MKKQIIFLMTISTFLIFSSCDNNSENLTSDLINSQDDTAQIESTQDKDIFVDNAPQKDETIQDENDKDIVDESITDISDFETQDSDNNIPNFELKKKFVGTWAQKLTLESDTDSPVGKVHSTTWRYRLEKITIGSDGELHRDTKICKITNYTSGSMTKGKTIFPQKFCEIYHFWHPYELSTPKPDISVSETNGKILFVENKSWELRGMKKMQNVETDKMPSDVKDSRIIDQDKDGKPGFTISFVGEGLSPTGDIYFVQRLSDELKSTKITEKDGIATKIAGNATWSDDEFNIDATNKLLKGNRTTTTLPSKFVFIRMKANATCDDIYDLKNNKEKISFE